jgi:hypothetical protein
MPTALPFDLTGPEADKLRAVLDGQEDFFSATARWNGSTYTVLVAKEGATAPTAPEPPKQDGYPASHWKPGSPQARAAARLVTTGVTSAEPSAEVATNETTEGTIREP